MKSFIVIAPSVLNPPSYNCTQCESKNPSEVFWHFFPNGWEFFVHILHAYYTFLSTLDYKFLFNCFSNHPACVSAGGGHFEHFYDVKWVVARLAVDMKFPIHIHIHIHWFLRGYPWIYPYPRTPILCTCSQWSSTKHRGGKGVHLPIIMTQTFPS